MNINILVTATELCDLCAPKFTLEACEELCAYLEEMAFDASYRIGNLCMAFNEIPADWGDDIDEDSVIARLKNGNILVRE